jgi:hypothetical protein
MIASIPAAVIRKSDAHGRVYMPTLAQVLSDQLPETVDKTEDMARLIDWGVDGLITDRPRLAARCDGNEEAAFAQADPARALSSGRACALPYGAPPRKQLT